ncbi:spermidine synthase, partial [Isoptericola sp. NPDC057559]
AEHAILKGRRYGNVVLVAVRSVPDGETTDGEDGEDGEDGDGTGGAPPTPLDLDDAALARRLRSLPVPARLLVGDELARFAGA